MDEIIARLKEHLQALPTAPLSAKILDSLDSQLCTRLSQRDALDIVTRVIQIVSTDVREDVSSLISLAERITEHGPSLQFSEILSSVPEANVLLIQGLTSDVIPLNRLALAILSTARSDTDTGIIANKAELVLALIWRWLTTSDTGVASKVLEIFKNLLGDPAGDYLDLHNNLMWRRLITDRDVYGSLFSITSLKSHGPLTPNASMRNFGVENLSRKKKSIAQFRLLDLLLAFAQVESLWQSHHREAEESCGLKPGEGLIHYGLLHMVDAEEDVLAKVQLLFSYSRFIQATNHGRVKTVAERILELFIERGIHQQLVRDFVQPDSSDPYAGFLVAPVARYIVTYVTYHAAYFLASSDRELIVERVRRNLNSRRNGDDPHLKGTIQVLAHLPRISILSTPSKQSPVLALPLQSADPEILSCLGHIFGGHVEDTTTVQVGTAHTAQQRNAEEAAARVLFYLYLGKHTDFYEKLIAAADIVALVDHAVNALEVILQLVTAKWQPVDLLPQDVAEVYPNEEALRSMSFPGQTLPLSKDGISALLMIKASTHIVPYLLSSSRHLTGPAYKIAQKRWDVLVAFVERLQIMAAKDELTAKEMKPLIEALNERIKNGILGNGVGATLDTSEGIAHSVATVSR